MNMLNKSTAFLVLVTLIGGQTLAQYEDIPMKYWPKEVFEQYLNNGEENRLLKTTAHVDRNFGMHDGNKLRTLFYNYGSVGRPNTEPSIEWPIYSNNGYAYEFGIVVGAEVVDAHGDTVTIFSDGMIDGGDRNQEGGSNVWGWEPVPGYGVDKDVYNSWTQVEKDRGGIAMSNRPETWGELFPIDEESGEYLWPGLFGNGVITADLESYYVMDDQYNQEFDYYPITLDSSIRGLGVQVTSRGYQYSASLAEDVIFFHYEIKNISDKPLEKVVVGMIGDPHIGGAGDFADDFAGFINRDGIDSETGETHNIGNMVYCWDKEGSGNSFGISWDELGWMGFKFLESPGVYNDGIDNDNDGFTDESLWDGVDNDGDWQATDEEAELDRPEENIYNGIDDDGDGRIDDLGDLDKKSDDLNGNGIPDLGEPDFDVTDVDESDQLGLTSFTAPVYATKQASQDEVIWEEMMPGNFTGELNPIPDGQDNIFIFGSGYFSLDVGETQRFSIAIIIGENKNDMINNAEIAEWIYRMNFQFTKPPDPPDVTAVSGPGRVTLYWEGNSENSIDPVFGKDFEGYKIYRSTKKGEWGKPITDNAGVTVGYQPIAQFDLNNEYEGNHPIPWTNGVQFYLGKNTGLVHSYVDSNLTDGITYFYAVTAYDRGTTEGRVAPLECAKSFGGPNVIEAVPNESAAGYIDPAVTITHSSGYATGQIGATILDRTQVDDDTKYIIEFKSFEIDSISHLKWQPTLSLADKSINIFKVINSDTFTLFENKSLNDIVNVWNNSLNVDPYDISFNDITSADEVYTPLYEWRNNDPVLDIQVEKASDWSTFYFTRDIEIQFADHYISADYKGDSTYLKVTNINENIPMTYKFKDNNLNQRLDPNDYIRIYLYKLENNFYYSDSLGGTKKSLYKLTFLPPSDTTLTDTIIHSGAIIRLQTEQPFDTNDKYVITGSKAYIDQAKVKSAMENIAVVPNPYIVSSSYEVPPPDVFSVGRGEREIHFIHLPVECTIKIFTISGEHIKTIKHKGIEFDGTESWNLLSDDGLDIATGIYIYHVETPQGYTKIGRIALIK